jgi:hypothetical protein
MEAIALVGTWRLLTWENIGPNGDITYPLGQHPSGFVTYTADGFMSTIITRADRPLFRALDALGGTPEEKLAAADHFFAYWGTYEYQGDRVLHRVVESFFPNWVGTVQVRDVQLTGDRLILSTPAMPLGGAINIGRLTWVRL